MAKWSSAQDLIGETLEGRFQLVRLLGEGGMGAVYEGRHLRLDARVAIKVLSRELAEDERQRKRFLREARAAVRIQHDNVVQIIDFGEEPVAYFVMEYLEGIDLAQLIQMSTRLPWARARGLILPMMRALCAAHKVGIIHRDVKPSNVFVTRREGEDVVKVLDFGIAKLSDPGHETRGVTRTDEVIGTVAYMSPEQALAHPVDVRSDIYSTGVMIFELLTGRVPYAGATQYQIMHQHINAAVPSMRAYEPSIPAAVDAVVMRALQKSPVERFPTMDAMLEAIVAIPETAVGEEGQAASSAPIAVNSGLTVVDTGLKPGAFAAPLPQGGDAHADTSPDVARSPETFRGSSSTQRSRSSWTWAGFGVLVLGGFLMGIAWLGDDAPKSLDAAQATPVVMAPDAVPGLADAALPQPARDAGVPPTEPGSAAPGLAAPGLAAPDSAEQDSAAPDSAAPGSAAPGHAAPDSAEPDAAEPGRAARNTTDVREPPPQSTSRPPKEATPKARKAPPARTRPPTDAALLRKIEAGSRRCGIRQPTKLKFQVMPNGAVLLVQSTPSNPCVDALARGLSFPPRERPQSMRVDLKP